MRVYFAPRRRRILVCPRHTVRCSIDCPYSLCMFPFQNHGFALALHCSERQHRSHLNLCCVLTFLCDHSGVLSSSFTNLVFANLHIHISHLTAPVKYAAYSGGPSCSRVLTSSKQRVPYTKKHNICHATVSTHRT